MIEVNLPAILIFHILYVFTSELFMLSQSVQTLSKEQFSPLNTGIVEHAQGFV